jgi:hypothetical protein
LSFNLLFLTSIKRSYFLSRSEPIIGDCTSAMTKIQRIGRRRPRFKVIDLLPYVLICELLAANSLKKHGLFPFSREVGGMTEMSAPVSMRKSLPDDLSVTNKRLIFGRCSSCAKLELP